MKLNSYEIRLLESLVNLHVDGRFIDCLRDQQLDDREHLQKIGLIEVTRRGLVPPRSNIYTITKKGRVWLRLNDL